MILIILLIAFGLLFGFNIFLLLALKSKYITNKLNALQGKLILNYNSEFQSIQMSKTWINSKTTSKIFDNRNFKNKNAWVSRDQLINSFPKISDQNIFKELFHDASVTPKKNSKFFITKNFINKIDTELKFKINISPTDDVNVHIVVLSWTNDLYIAANTNIIPEMVENDIIYNTKKYWGFIAFNSSIQDESISKFIETFWLMNRKRHFHYFVVQNIIVLFVASNLKNKINNSINKIINKINKKSNKGKLNYFYTESSYLQIKNANNPKQISNIIYVLEYLNILSKIEEQSFANKKTKGFLREKVQQFIKLVGEFNKAISDKNIDHNLIAIRKNDHPHAIIHYNLSSISNVPRNIHNFILINQYRRQELTDASANLMATETIKIPIILDINDYWLKTSSSKINNKNIVYNIEFLSEIVDEQTILIIKKLKKSGINFSFRLKMFDEEFSSLVIELMPEFIIIDSAISQSPFTPNEYISILSINKLAKNYNIKVIFENPIEHLDEQMKKKLGIEYYYNTLD